MPTLQLTCCFLCLAKWQRQYKLMENAAPVITRVLLLVLENIEINTRLDTKLPCTIKMKGADGKCKMEAMDSQIPKTPEKAGLTDKYCMICKRHDGPHMSHNMCDCHCFIKDTTPIKKCGGIDKPHSKQTLHRRWHSASTCTSASSIMLTNWKVVVPSTTVLEN